MATTSDAALMDRLRQGDEQALGVLYDEHGPMIRALTRSMLGADEDAEEVTEDTFMQLWRRPHRYDPSRGSVRTFLATVARSRALDRIRSRRRREAAHADAAATGSDGMAIEVASPEAADARLERTSRRTALSDALSHVSPVQREAIELAYLSGYTQREIADHLDEPLGTIKTRIRDGMAKLRTHFSGSTEGDVR